MSKVCVFFGAGAEQAYKISGGKEFATAVLGIEVDHLNEAVKEYYNNRLEKCTLEHRWWYPDYHNYRWKDAVLLQAAVEKKFLDESHLYDHKKDYEEEVRKEVEELLEGQAGERSKVIENYTSYMGILDARFHTLISPKLLGPQKFWSVLASYTRAYCLIAGQILYPEDNEKGPNRDQYLKVLNEPAWVNQEMRRIAAEDKTKSYYSVLNECNIHNLRVITSNYTPYCSEVMKLNSNKIAYVHGQFGNFELPYELKIIDAEQAQASSDIYFPYIFIQSAIKPIIEETQILEYAKMIEFLREVNSLVILGYRINSDDNDINAILRSFLQDQNKRIVYLNYKNGSKEEIAYRLRVQADHPNLEFIKIDEEDCFSVFKDCVLNCC